MTQTATLTPLERLGDEYEFYKCLRCLRICSQTEMLAAIGQDGAGSACPCGGLKYSPVQVTWRDFYLPQVITFARHKFGETADQNLQRALWDEAREDGLTDEAIAVEIDKVRVAQAGLR
jgi:hypothetical protein